MVILRGLKSRAPFYFRLNNRINLWGQFLFHLHRVQHVSGFFQMKARPGQVGVETTAGLRCPAQRTPILRMINHVWV